MELSVLDMYWLIKLDDIRGLVFGLVLISVIFLIGLLTFYSAQSESKGIGFNFKRFGISSIFIVFFVIICLTTRALIPSTTQMAALIVVPKIVNNAQVQELPNKLLDLSAAWLDELKPKEAK